MWWYIATQAPLEETTTDFWQMVWEQEVDVIAMLTDLSVSVEQMTVIFVCVGVFLCRRDLYCGVDCLMYL